MNDRSGCRRWRALAFLLLSCLLACGGPADPLDGARSLHQEGRYRESIDPLRQLIDRGSAPLEAHLLLGTALMRTGQASLAVWPLRRASESPEYAVEAGLLLTEAMLDSRTAPDALDEIEKVLAVEPENVAALGLRMQALLATGRRVEALAVMDRILELDPENLGVLVPRVTALIGEERIEEAEAALDLAREKIEGTDKSVGESQRARLCIARGLFAFEKGDREVAEVQYAKCLEAYPTDPLAVTETAAFYDRLEMSERATEILRAAAEVSDEGFFRMTLARRLGALGDLEEAERLLRAEAAERPSQSIWFALADFYVQQEAFEPAVDAFERALAAGVQEPPPMLRFAYADTLVQAKQLDKAREQLPLLPLQEFRALIRGRILLAEGDASGALAAFDTGLRLWPNNPAGRFLAAQAAERTGQFERAVSDYRESLRAGAAQTDAGLALAPLHAAQKDYEGALDALRNYVRTHPRDPQGYLTSIRIAHDAERHVVASEGLRRLALLPGQQAVAVAMEAELVALKRGPAGAIESIEASELDLTDPVNRVALRLLVTSLGELGEHAKAEDRVGKALTAHPDEAAFHALQAQVSLAAGDGGESAGAAFERALELDPANASALVGMARLSAQRGDVAAALALYDRALAAEDLPETAVAAARLQRDSDPEAAIARLVTLLDHHPREAGAALELARWLLEQGELERALDFARRAAWFHEPGADQLLAELRERQQG